METEIDKQVQQLYDVVQNKKSEIAKAERPEWKTNCSFRYIVESASSTNLQVEKDIRKLAEILAFLIEKEKAFNESNSFLGLKLKFEWLGFNLNDWKSDIKTRVSKIEINKKRADLEVLENRLNDLISPELKRKLELEAIRKAIDFD